MVIGQQAKRGFMPCYPVSRDAAMPVAMDETAVRFLITVDTEEAFDWNSPFARNNRDTSHLAALDRFQAMCAGRGIRPVYLIDEPVVEDDAAAAMFARLCAQHEAYVGMHLHPWVSEPFEEVVNHRNSFACNLPAELESRKIIALYEKISARIGVKPDIFRAGRYGAGPETIRTLQRLSVRIDSSVRSLFDYRADQGPVYSDASLAPYWVEPGKLAELPLTSVFCGHLRGFGPSLYPFERPGSRKSGILSRLGLLERVPLTPEGVPASKVIEAIDTALEMGLTLLNFSFHSPSLVPGNTPYVRSARDLEKQFAWWNAVLNHLEHRNVRPADLNALIFDIFSNFEQANPKQV